MRKPLFVRFFVAVSIFLLPFAAPPAQQPVSAQSADFSAAENGILSHYIVFQQDETGAIQPVYYRQVMTDAHFYDAASTLDDVSLLAAPSRSTQRIGVSLTDARGATVFATAVDVPEWIRGEFENGSGGTDGIDGHFFQIDRPVFVVRVPVIADTRLILRGAASGATFAFNPDALAQDRTLALAGYEVEGGIRRATVFDTGPSANRVDLLLMGDGYTAAQAATFDTDVANVVGSFFGITPYADYRSYIKVGSLFTASAQSGADHPPYSASCSQADPISPTCCPDPAMSSDALAGTFRTTAFDSSFCSYGIHRLLGINYTKVLAAAAAYPNWDNIMVLVNDPTYGGVGGIIGAFSMHPSAVQIAQHEYGHSFAALADEYSDPYPGYPSCSDTDASAFNDCEANVTNQTVRASIKWNRWIDASTPIVTPPTSPYLDPSVIGLFQGARYLTSGMYRPGYNCLMRSLGVPLCAVASEAYVLRLYDGGFGYTPQAGIENIEPGTTSPGTAAVAMNTCAVQVFGAQLLGPTGTDRLLVRWYVDGVQVSETYADNADVVNYPYIPTSVGAHTVKLWVGDRDIYVHPSIQDSIASTYSWSVTVSAGSCAALDVDVGLQGRPPAPDASWIVPLSVKIVRTSDSLVVFEGTVMTDNTGTFTVSNLPPGSSTVWVKHSHSLATAVTTTLVAGSQSFNLGTLREGDANDNNAVTINDFAILAAAFGTTTGGPMFDARADFNNDGAVTILDFSMLAANFGQTGATEP